MTEASAVPGSIRALLDERAATLGSRPAVIDPETGETLDYRTLRERAARIAAALVRRGLRRGESVAYAMVNGPEAVLAVLGIQYGGFRALAVNLVSGRDAIAYALAHGEARLVLSHAPAEALVHEALASGAEEAGGSTAPETLSLEGLTGEGSAAGDATSGDATGGDEASGDETGGAPTDAGAIDCGDDALLMYTSGTTGRPKGVRLTHANLLAGGRNAATGHGLDERDRALCTLPLFHINGLCVTLYAPLVSGGSVVVPPRFSASAFWPTIEAHRCTWFSVVPTQVGYLLHAEGEVRVGERVRFGRSASAPLAPDVHRAFVERFGVPLVETMGLTETAAQITSNPMPPGEGRLGSAGRAHGCRVRAVDGELRVLGDNVMRGYFRNEAATREAFDDEGWFRTGDLGRIDGDGFVFVTGRSKELIIKGGENIAPREIDEALLAHPDVLEAAAFGTACDDYGERVIAAVVAVPGREIDIGALLAWCEARVGRFRRPDRLHVLEELPKGPSGKIQRRRCAALCEALDEG